MTSINSPQCFGCERFRPAKGLWRCTAYPNGIPDAIIGGLHDHKRPYKGDGGTMFLETPYEEVQWDRPVEEAA